MGFLKEHHLGYVFIEGYYMPPIAEVFGTYDTLTTDFSVIHLHGRDRLLHGMSVRVEPR